MGLTSEELHFFYPLDSAIYAIEVLFADSSIRNRVPNHSLPFDLLQDSSFLAWPEMFSLDSFRKGKSGSVHVTPTYSPCDGLQGNRAGSSPPPKCVVLFLGDIPKPFLSLP